MVDKRVTIYGLNEFIQIGDRRDEAYLELGEKSGTRSARCNSKFASIVAGGFLSILAICYQVDLSRLYETLLYVTRTILMRVLFLGACLQTCRSKC